MIYVICFVGGMLYCECAPTVDGTFHADEIRFDERDLASPVTALLHWPGSNYPRIVCGVDPSWICFCGVDSGLWVFETGSREMAARVSNVHGDSAHWKFVDLGR